MIRLHANENPLVNEVAGSSEYPEISGETLRRKIADFCKVSLDQTILGAGSNELIHLAVSQFGRRAGRKVLLSKASFISYEQACQNQNVDPVFVDTKAHFQVDLEGFLSAAKTDLNLGLIFLANPNNPTGEYVSRDYFFDFLKKLAALPNVNHLTLLLDQAYFEYLSADEQISPHEIWEVYPRTVVLRTFSKIYGLAGFRVGYALGPVDLISELHSIRLAFNVNAVGMGLAQQALERQNFVEASRVYNRQELQKWTDFFMSQNISFVPTGANFISFHVPPEFGDLSVILAKERILIQSLAAQMGAGWYRASMGSIEQNVLVRSRIQEVFHAAKSKK